MRERPYGFRDVALRLWLEHGVVGREVGGQSFGGFWFCVRLVNPVAVRAPPGFEAQRQHGILPVCSSLR